MSSIAITGGATGTGVFSLLAPSTSTNRTINLPDSNGTILTTATAGVPVNGPAFSAYFTGSQTITSNVATKVQINTEEFDTNSNFDSATNYRFTPTVAGYYQVNGCIYPSTSTTNSAVYIYKNGANFKFANFPANNSSAFVSAVIYLNGSTDYLELYGYLTGTTPAFQAGVAYNTFSAAMVRGA